MDEKQQPTPKKKLQRANLKPIRERIVSACLARAESDELSRVVTQIGFTRNEFLEVLAPVKGDNERARQLYAGVLAAKGNPDMCIQREHLLVALGEMDEYEKLEALPSDGQTA